MAGQVCVVTEKGSVMPIKVRKWKGKRFDFELDVSARGPDGRWERKRKGFNGSKADAKVEANAMLAEILSSEDEEKPPEKEVPTLAAFESKFMTDHLDANRLKPTTVDTYKYRLRIHLLPKLGHLRLDQIDLAAVQGLKSSLKGQSTNAVNHTLGVLSKVLVFAWDIGVLKSLLWRLKTVKLKPTKPKMQFYDFPEYAALVAAAANVGKHDLALVLLGGEAGLRRGEIAALEWTDVDLRRAVLTVCHTVYKGQLTLPKGGNERKLSMTKRLLEALTAIKPEGKATGRVLRQRDGSVHTETSINEVMPRLTKAAGLKVSRKVHILRHTFCSHLAMRGAKPIQVMELAGHTDLKTTQRYMHLSASMKDSAIRLLEQPIPEGAAA
jgi:integrase